MSKVAQLKKKAAECEQKKQYDRALAVYIQAIEAAERPDDRDIQLYNRVGDLYLRLGDVNQAVIYYEQAVDLYTDGGFFSNAIALCNKVLRHVPSRTLIYYKLGKISAKKGFNSDAKQNFLEYAGRMQQAGQLDEAFRALKEFADLCPGQDDVRLMLAEQLGRVDRRAEALEQLQIIYDTMLAEDRHAEASATLDRIRAIDPAFEPKQGSAQRQVKRDGLVFIDINSEPQSMIAAQVAADQVAGVSVSSPRGSAGDSQPADSLLDAPADISVSPDEVVAMSGLELTSLAEEESPLGVGAENGGTSRATEPSPLDGVTPVEDDMSRLALVAADAEPEPVPGMVSSLLESEPMDAGHVDAGRLDIADVDAGHEDIRQVESLAIIETGIATEDVPAHAMLDTLDALATNDTHGTAIVERDVEMMVIAPVASAAELALTPVVDLVAAVAAAESFSAPVTSSSAVGAPASVASTDEFVDLTAWLRDSQPAPNPRMTAQAEEEITGAAQQADFSEMLETFKRGIAQNVDDNDSESHYDLGVAYMEMGLFTEAITQFQKVLRGNSLPERRVRAYESLGHCFIEQGQHDIARASLAGALSEPGLSEDKLVGVLYLLGTASELTGKWSEAQAYYKRVVAIDITFRDVNERLRRATRTAVA